MLIHLPRSQKSVFLQQVLYTVQTCGSYVPRYCATDKYFLPAMWASGTHMCLSNPASGFPADGAIS